MTVRAPKLAASDVLRYLKDHPSFLAEHQAEFAVGGDPPGAARFYERQLDVLRERVDEHRDRLETLLDHARDNEQLDAGLFALAVDLLAAPRNGADPLAAAGALACARFGFAAWAVFGAGRGDETAWPAVRERIVHGGSTCDDRVAGALRTQLFGAHGDAVRSCAFVPVPVAGDATACALVLGSADPAEFRPGMGVLYLDRLGQLLGGFLAGRA